MGNRPVAAALLCACAMTGVPAVASAHAFLRTSSPAVGGTVQAAPVAVAITFTEGVEPAFTTIQVTDARGARVDRGSGHLEGDDTHFAVGLRPALPPGRYTVTWRAVATDTHHTEGAFTFTVAP